MRIPPTERCPLSPRKRRFFPSATNFSSSSSLGSRKTMFMNERASAIHRRTEELRVCVDDAVDEPALLPVVGLHRLQAAHLLDRGQHVADHVDREAGGRVVERIVLRVRLVVQDRRDAVLALLQDVLADDHRDHAGRADVLLCAGVDEPERLRVEGAQRKSEDMSQMIGTPLVSGTAWYCVPSMVLLLVRWT